MRETSSPVRPSARRSVTAGESPATVSLRGGERVAVGDRALLHAALEPFDSLLRRAVRPRFRIHARAGRLLDAVVTDRGGGADALLDVAVLQDVALLRRVRPHAGQ